MISGTVTLDLQATIPLTVAGPGGQMDLEVVLDTGFDDELTLPGSVISSLGLAFIGPADATLADGSTLTLSVYGATVLWHGQPRAVFAIEADGGALAGMTLLRGSRLTVDVVDGGAVEIQELP